ncbi:MAG: S8 family serine peptidase [Gammaproteobacteria bacterium]|nr:S8 family serine peptidase [Gammaproteobacteria bacterium]
MSWKARAGVFGVLLAFGLWLAYELVPRTTVEEEQSVEKDRLAIEEALAQIERDSQNIDVAEQSPHRTPTQLAKPPPGFEPTPLTDRSATPPEGYGFVTHHDVKRGPMTEADVDRGPAAPTPDWMSSSELAEVAGRDWTFGWIKLADGSTLEELRVALTAQGGAVLGRSGNLLRARVPSDASRLRELADSTAVAGIGAVPADAKMPVSLSERALSGSRDEVPVWITLMDDDPEGRWRAALADLGAVVGYFDPTIRTYAANLPLDALFSVASADYVLAVEAIGRVVPTLEMASAAMGADALRSYDAATGLFAGIGGASVAVGVMDSGLNVDHRDIGSNRRSICGANFTNLIFSREEDQDLWFDFNGHGTHVAGIAFGNGAVESNRAGMAPLVQDIRMAKVLSTWGGASALGWGRAMDWFATPTACGDGAPRKALVINSSVGVTHPAWEGRSVVERKIDAAVWGAKQLFVTSAGNAVDQGTSSMAGAKNALTVGATDNGGDIAEFSSLGPTYDGRLLPKVVATGVEIVAAEGEGSRSGYEVRSGTSMASPSVVGVAALAMDAVPALKEEPAALRAHLMASAIKPDAFLADAHGFPPNNTAGPGTLQNTYGLGKVSARTAVLRRDMEDGWTGGTAAFDMDADSHAYHDITVPEGASRLDVVMTWDEPPAETITDPVLHDLDLWLDRHASCGTVAACGQHRSQSRIDNVEWVIVPNPAPGTYRLKVLPNRIHGPSPRAGLAWTVIRGDSTPTLDVAIDQDAVSVAPEVAFDLTIAVASDSYVAAGANLRMDCRAEDASDACREVSYVVKGESNVVRDDGTERSLARDEGDTMVLGEIGPDERQTVTVRVSGRQEGSFRLHFAASAWNATAAEASVPVVVGSPGSAAPDAVGAPQNDDFAAAMHLDGAEGETAFDLLHATREPGEPLVRDTPVSPLLSPRSIWYEWQALEDGPVRFSVVPGVEGDYADNVVVGVYRGDTVAGLTPVGTPRFGGGSTFFAAADTTYRLRLAIHDQSLLRTRPNAFGFGTVTERRSTPVLTLRWAPGHRPANDDYALAARLEGETGFVAGNNQAATTEPGELMGFTTPWTPAVLGPGKASSIWYRWTAPASGDWRFAVDRENLVVAAYSGDRVGESRLVSGTPASEAVFPALAGAEYRISVASIHAYVSGAEFELAWAPGGGRDPASDDVAEPARAFGNFAFVSVDVDALTVEPGEPAESGSRTAWIAWQPPADGRFTWRILRAGFFSTVGEAPLQQSVFEGDTLDALELVAHDEGDETMDQVLAFDVRADATYRLALGLPRDAAEVPLGDQTFILEWGETPSNDDVANAMMLASSGGTYAGSNAFATTEKGEMTGTLGDSSLWWALEPDETGWMRFAAEGLDGLKLAVYRRGEDGTLQLVRAGRTLGETGSVSFLAEAGVRYLVRLGAYYWDQDGFGGNRLGDFELSWSPADPPASLRYVGSVASGDLAEDGTVVELGELGAQAFNADGTELYVVSRLGIVVFARDGPTGELTLRQTLPDYAVFDDDARLLWDAQGDALLVATCDAWWKFTPREDGGIEFAGEVGGAPCPGGRLLLRDGFVHNVMDPWMIETYEFDEMHELLSLVSRQSVAGVVTAEMTADGSNVYALRRSGDADTLLAMERDAETGSLSIVAIIAEGAETPDGATVEGLANIRGMAVHGSHLYLSAEYGDTLVFDLANRSSPAFLGKLETILPIPPNFARCWYPVARGTVPAVDIACGFHGDLYTIQVGRDGTPFASDHVRADGSNNDSFGNPVPFYIRLGSIVRSPDDRHLYLASFWARFTFPPGIYEEGHRMLVFESVNGY